MFHVPHKVGAGRTAKNCLTLRSKGRRAIKPRSAPELGRWASLHPTVPAPQVPAQDRGSRDMPVPDSSASSCRCYGCRPIRRRHGAGSCRGSSTTVSCMRCRARHTRRFSFFHPHVTQSSNPLSAMPHGVLIRHKRISPFMPPRKASAHTRFGYRNPVHVGLLGRRNAQLIIPADAQRAPLNSGVMRQRHLACPASCCR